MGRGQIPEYRSIDRGRRMSSTSLMVYHWADRGQQQQQMSIYSVLIVVDTHTAHLHLSLGHQGRKWSHATIIGQHSQPTYFGIVKRARTLSDKCEGEE